MKNNKLKRAAAVLLLSALVAGATPASAEEPAAEAPEPSESGLMGDTDADGRVTASDARDILRAAVSLDGISEARLPYADLTEDGLITAADARKALRISVELDPAGAQHEYILTACTPASCTAPGYAAYACRICQKTGELNVPPTGHSYLVQSEKPATCVLAGERVLVCAVCGADSVSVLPKKAHSYAVSGNSVKCAACGAPAEGWTKAGGGSYYCVKGEMCKSWREIGGEYYFFDRASGVMAAGTSVDGIPLGADGRAEKTAYTVEKIKTFIKAKAIVESITSPSDSVDQKKLKCFRWVMRFPYKQYRQVGQAMKTPGFEMLFANDIFDRGAGCCGSTSYAFAFLAVEAGCKSVYVCDDGVSTGGHAWVTMEGNNRVYDVIFAEAKGFNINYDAAVSDYRRYPPRKTYVGG